MKSILIKAMLSRWMHRMQTLREVAQEVTALLHISIDVDEWPRYVY